MIYARLWWLSNGWRTTACCRQYQVYMPIVPCSKAEVYFEGTCQKLRVEQQLRGKCKLGRRIGSWRNRELNFSVSLTEANPRKMTIDSRYREIQEIEASRNRDFTVNLEER